MLSTETKYNEGKLSVCNQQWVTDKRYLGSAVQKYPSDGQLIQQTSNKKNTRNIKLTHNPSNSDTKTCKLRAQNSNQPSESCMQHILFYRLIEAIRTDMYSDALKASAGVGLQTSCRALTSQEDPIKPSKRQTTLTKHTTLTWFL